MSCYWLCFPPFLHTGSKCPTGEYQYVISTDSSDRLKSLFHNLSEHKPIFRDDMLGRRMTSDRRKRGRPNTGSAKVPAHGRYSLQHSAPVYENRSSLIDISQQNFSSPPRQRRHSVVDERILNPLHSRATASGSPRAARSIEDLSSRLYQNVQHGSQCSPAKRLSQLSSITSSGDIPPPPVLRKSRTSGSSSPEGSSPAEGMFTGEESPLTRRSPPISEEDAEDEGEPGPYIHFAPPTPSSPVKLSLSEHNVVLKREGPRASRAPVQQTNTEAVYENLEFKRPKGPCTRGLPNTPNPVESTRYMYVHNIKSQNVAHDSVRIVLCKPWTSLHFIIMGNPLRKLASSTV